MGVKCCHVDGGNVYEVVADGDASVSLEECQENVDMVDVLRNVTYPSLVVPSLGVIPTFVKNKVDCKKANVSLFNLNVGPSSEGDRDLISNLETSQDHGISTSGRPKRNGFIMGGPSGAKAQSEGMETKFMLSKPSYSFPIPKRNEKYRC